MTVYYNIYNRIYARIKIPNTESTELRLICIVPCPNTLLGNSPDKPLCATFQEASTKAKELASLLNATYDTVPCVHCLGTSINPTNPELNCPECSGLGAKYHPQPNPYRIKVKESPAMPPLKQQPINTAFVSTTKVVSPPQITTPKTPAPAFLNDPNHKPQVDITLPKPGTEATAAPTTKPNV